jgi:colanic acid/amylovoran biosynthesis glycosyltransferase
MKKIAVIRAWFLPISETFIYSELVSLKKVDPIVYCKRKMNLDHFPVGRIYEYKEMTDLMSMLRNHRVDLIHARFGVTGAEMLDVKEKLGIPMLTSFHGFDVPSNKRVQSRYQGKLDRLFRSCDAFTVTSINMKKILQKYGCPKEKIIVHHSGIDTDSFQYKERSYPKNGTITLLTVGRLVEKKGMKYLIHAFRKVYNKHPNLRLRIVGDGPLRKDLEGQVRRYGIGEAVKFLGEMPHKEIVKEYEAAHLFVLASATSRNGDQEGIPNAIKEAMACGLPVVSTEHAGIPELVSNGKSGYLVPERNAKALASRLEKLIIESRKWRMLGLEGRKRVRKSFHSKKQIQELEMIYAKLIGNRKKGG